MDDFQCENDPCLVLCWQTDGGCDGKCHPTGQLGSLMETEGQRAGNKTITFCSFPTECDVWCFRNWLQIQVKFLMKHEGQTQIILQMKASACHPSLWIFNLLKTELYTSGFTRSTCQNHYKMIHLVEIHLKKWRQTVEKIQVYQVPCFPVIPSWCECAFSSLGQLGDAKGT